MTYRFSSFTSFSKQMPCDHNFTSPFSLCCSPVLNIHLSELHVNGKIDFILPLVFWPLAGLLQPVIYPTIYYMSTIYIRRRLHAKGKFSTQGDYPGASSQARTPAP